MAMKTMTYEQGLLIGAAHAVLAAYEFARTIDPFKVSDEEFQLAHKAMDTHVERLEKLIELEFRTGFDNGNIIQMAGMIVYMGENKIDNRMFS